MRLLKRTKYLAVMLLLPFLAAAAFLLASDPFTAKAEQTYYPSVYEFRVYSEYDNAVQTDVLKLRLDFDYNSAYSDYVTFYATVTDFTSCLPEGQEIPESFTVPRLEWFINGKLVAFYNIYYEKDLDAFTLECFLKKEYTALVRQGLTVDEYINEAYYEVDCEFLENTLNIELEYKLRIGLSNIASLVTFDFIWYEDSRSQVQKLFYYGETPALPAPYEHWDRLFFKGWSPAIQPVTGSAPLTYTAQYEYPSVIVKNADGTETRQYLEYDWLDESILFANYTGSVDDVASTDVKVGDLVSFENRRDFWYCQAADTEVKHTVDTNLTLEAISLRIKDKDTNVTYRLQLAKESEVAGKKGFFERLWGYIDYTFNLVKHTFQNFGETFKATFQKFFADDSSAFDAVLMDFLYEYYPEFAKENPDHYELVYMYYYSVDLKEQIESGEVDDAYVDYVDSYKDSTLTVTNNINDVEYTLTNSYSLERGNYFVLDMARYWQSMGYITKEQYLENESHGLIVNSLYRITVEQGEIVYDTVAASQLDKALTTQVYYCTGDFYPDYADSYTLYVEFYNPVVYKEPDKTIVDTTEEVLSPVTDILDNFITGVEKATDWLSEHWYVILIGAAVIAVVFFVGKFIIALIPRKTYTVSKPPKRRKKK